MADKKRKKRRNGKSTITASASAARTSSAALNAIRAEQSEKEDEASLVRNNVYKMIDQGTGTIVDLWAPPRMKILSDYIELGEETLAICTVSNWPTRLSYGWLNNLLEDPDLADVKIDVSMHIHPIRKEYAQQYMQDKKISAESSKLAEQERGKNTSQALKVYNEQIDTAQLMYDILQNESENLYQVSLTFGIYGHAIIDFDENGNRRVIKDSKEDVVEKMDRFKHALAKNSGGGFAVKPLLHQQRDGIKSLLPWGYGGLHSFQNMYTSALATCYPFTHGELAVEDGILYGVNPFTQQPYFFDSFNRNWVNSYSCAIMGGTGTGKSATVKTLLGRYGVHGTQIFIVDPAINTKGEYTNLATSLDGSVIDFGGKSGVSMNPFALVPPDTWEPGMKTDRGAAILTYREKKDYLIGLFDLMREKYVKENNSRVELETFSRTMNVLIDRTYMYRGMAVNESRIDYTQWNQQHMPTINDFYTVLSEYKRILQTYTDFDRIKGWGVQHTRQGGGLIDKQTPSERIMFGYYRNVLATQNVWGRQELDIVSFMCNVISEYVIDEKDETYSEKAALFSGKKHADLSAPCVVFRFGDVKPALKDIATYLAFELVYTRINTTHHDGMRQKYIVVMDECWKMLSSPSARKYIVKLSREGRKLNTGLWTISQKYEDFQGDNSVLFDQSETKIILGLSGQEVDQLTTKLDLSPTLASIINMDTTNIQPGTGLLHVGGKRHATVAFYCVQSKLESMIADTSDMANNKPPLQLEDIRKVVQG